MSRDEPKTVACPACGQRVAEHPEGGPVAHKPRGGRAGQICPIGRPDESIWQ